MEIQITEVEPGKFQAKIGDWTSGTPRKMRTVTRRIEAYQKLLADEKAAKMEAQRRRDAPKKTCPRCKGTGYLDIYLHVAKGICFKCGGAGEVEI